jgi:hypothetical protein
MAAFGAHAAGHYFAARRSAVGVRPPCFVPALSLSGIGGVYTKLHWPIRPSSLVRIFAAGPIAGFATSALLFLVGLPMSHAISLSSDYIQFGDSLFTAAAERMLVPGLTPSQGVMLHPVALAGYYGLFFNLWHLLPVGRLDAGRVVYALLGYRRARLVSWLAIGVLALLVIVSPAWLWVACFAALTMIRISRQHPPEYQGGSIDRHLALIIGLLVVILLLTFVPVPVRFVSQTRAPRSDPARSQAAPKSAGSTRVGPPPSSPSHPADFWCPDC